MIPNPRTWFWVGGVLPPLLLFLHGLEAVSWLRGKAGFDSGLAAWCALVWPWFLWRIGGSDRVRGLWSRLDDPAARVGLVLVVALHLVALLAPMLVTHSPTQHGDPVLQRYLEPSGAHWLGTDALGRDLYSRLVYGSRISLLIGVTSVLVNLVLGSVIGGVAGFFRGWTDGVLMRFTDLMIAFPRVFLVLMLVALYRPSPLLIIFVLGTTGWMIVARAVRGEVLRVRNMEFVVAAEALGFSRFRVLARHVLPLAIAPVVGVAALRVGQTILVESFLSFLGLGVNDPHVSWGLLMREGRAAQLSAWWISTFPGLAILITVVGYNLLGDGLRDAYDPRLSPRAHGEP